MQTVLKLYDSYTQVEDVLHFLRREGYVLKQINLVASKDALEPALNRERGRDRQYEGISDLSRLGIVDYPDERVVIVGSSGATAEASGNGFHGVLAMLGVPADKTADYRRAVRDGKMLLSMRIAAEQSATAQGILDQPQNPDYARGMHPEGDEKPGPDYARGMHELPEDEREPDYARGMHPEGDQEPGPDYARGMREDERD